MLTTPRPAAAPQRAPRSGYILLPLRMIQAHHDSPQAIGVYALVGRLFLAHGGPVPLSANDVAALDPRLSRGGVLRALDRLLAGGWLVAHEQPGRKTIYQPGWGRAAGADRPWRSEAPGLGRPSHSHAARLDEGLLDHYLGRLLPHPTRRALVTRYVAEPPLGLADVGTYALALIGAAVACPALEALGLLAGGRPRQPPDGPATLAAIGPEALTAPGRRLVGAACPADVIAPVIGGGITNLIGQGPGPDAPASPPLSATAPAAAAAPPPTRSHTEQMESDSPPTHARPGDRRRVVGGEADYSLEKRPPRAPGGLNATGRYLAATGVSVGAALALQHLHPAAVASTVEGMLASGSGPGAIVLALRHAPPAPDAADTAAAALAPPALTPPQLAALAACLRAGSAPEAALAAVAAAGTPSAPPRRPSAREACPWIATAPPPPDSRHHALAATLAPAGWGPARRATLAMYLAAGVERAEALAATLDDHPEEGS